MTTKRITAEASGPGAPMRIDAESATALPVEGRARLQTLPRLARLGISACLLLVVSCSREIPPCLQWATPGETYEVTLGRASRLPHPYDDSCGPDFDVSEGDAFRLRSIARENPASWCAFLDARVESAISGVTFGAPGPLPVGFFQQEMEATYPDAQVQDSCRGGYWIGLTAQTGVLHAYRGFYPAPDPECLSKLNLPEGRVRCWDSWLVQVKNSKGEVVADSTVGPG